MVHRAAWVMSEEDIFGTLNVIEDRLTQPGLDQRQVDMLVRLRAMLEEDVDALHSGAKLEPLRTVCGEEAQAI